MALYSWLYGFVDHLDHLAHLATKLLRRALWASSSANGSAVGQQAAHAADAQRRVAGCDVHARLAAGESAAGAATPKDPASSVGIMRARNREARSLTRGRRLGKRREAGRT